MFLFLPFGLQHQLLADLLLWYVYPHINRQKTNGIFNSYQNFDSLGFCLLIPAYLPLHHRGLVGLSVYCSYASVQYTFPFMCRFHGIPPLFVPCLRLWFFPHFRDTPADTLLPRVESGLCHSPLVRRITSRSLHLVSYPGREAS